jgi:hypothetical protein
MVTQQMSVEVLCINRKNINKDDGCSVQFMQPNIKNGSEKNTIVILGDFHTRGCANKIKYTLNKNVNITYFVKPGSHIPTLRVSAKGAVENLTKNYKILFFERGRGTLKMLGKNNTKESCKHVLNFVINSSHTNII